MKKIISTGLALVLALSMSMTAFAGNSSEINSGTNASSEINSSTNESSEVNNDSDTDTEDTTSSGSYATAISASTAVDANGASIDVSISTLTVAVQADAKDAVAEKYGTGTEVYGACEVTAAEGTSFPIYITFKVSGVSAGNVAVYHKANGTWQEEPFVVGNGTVTVKFTSLSPVVFVKAASTNTTTFTVPTTTVSADVHYHSYDVNVVAPTETTWGYTIYSCECGYSYVDNYVAPLGGTTSASSPKTSDNGAFGFVLTALVCGVAFVILNRKKTI